MTVRLLYSSLLTSHQRAMVEQAVRAAISNRTGEWVFSLVDPPRQRLVVITVDGPNDFTRTWAFEEADQHYAAIRQTISHNLVALS